MGHNDRVAIVLKNGPAMAACFLAVSGGATAAPLNPAYKSEEFEFYLTDLEPKILVIEEGELSPAIEVAAKLEIPVVRLKANPEQGAGHFAFIFSDAMAVTEVANREFAKAHDIALLLHTSGTTSRPKLVPLRHNNLCASALSVATTLGLTEHDRGLNMMPLFHIHGLVAGLLAPLSAGGCVICSRGFNALKFFGWMAEARPTWYSAVPTMHQAILARAPKSAEIIKGNPLRFIRSSSSSIPPQVIHEIEEAFRCPLIEFLRHDRGVASDGKQSATARLEKARQRWVAGWAGNRNRGPEWQTSWTRGDGRDRDPRRECYEWLCKQ